MARLMGSTPAGELARIKVQHPVWSIRAARLDDGAGFIARRRLADGRLEQLRAPSPGDPERAATLPGWRRAPVTPPDRRAWNGPGPPAVLPSIAARSQQPVG